VLLGAGILGSVALGARYLLRSGSAAAKGFGYKFYEGGFEKVMSKREAAMVLGCRTTSSSARVMERYRTLMKLNHPDLGGSPFLSQKVNQAKDLLLKGSSVKEKK